MSLRLFQTLSCGLLWLLIVANGIGCWGMWQGNLHNAELLTQVRVLWDDVHHACRPSQEAMR